MLLLSRNRALQVRNMVTAAVVTRTIRGLPTEVPLSEADGMPQICVVNLDVIITFEKSLVDRRICGLSAEKLSAVARAVKFALALE